MNIILRTILLALSSSAFSGQFDIDKHPTYCPPPSAFTKDPETLTWTGPMHWKSFNPSFANKLVRFEKVEWQGINIGLILCTYQTDNESAFPVFIQAPGNYQKPNTGDTANWRQLGDTISCTQTDRMACGFYRVQLHQEKLSTNQDIIRFLDEVKDTPDPIPKFPGQ